MNTATAYKVGTKNYLIHSQKRAASGIKVASAPFFNIAQNATASIISSAIKESLNYDSNTIVSDPHVFDALEEAFTVLGR